MDNSKDYSNGPVGSLQASAGVRAVAPARRRHPGFGLMKGFTWIAPEVDLTEPAMPEWADLIDEKYGKEP